METPLISTGQNNSGILSDRLDTVAIDNVPRFLGCEYVGQPLVVPIGKTAGLKDN